MWGYVIMILFEIGFIWFLVQYGFEKKKNTKTKTKFSSTVL